MPASVAQLNERTTQRSSTYYSSLSKPTFGAEVSHDVSCAHPLISGFQHRAYPRGSTSCLSPSFRQLLCNASELLTSPISLRMVRIYFLLGQISSTVSIV